MIKDERVWNDPVLNDPKLSDSRLWKLQFIGGINLIMGFILYVIINYADVPVNAIPGLFLCVGGVFCMYGGYVWYKSTKAIKV